MDPRQPLAGKTTEEIHDSRKDRSGNPTNPVIPAVLGGDPSEIRHAQLVYLRLPAATEEDWDTPFHAYGAMCDILSHRLVPQASHFLLLR